MDPIEFIKQLFTPVKPLPTGMHHTLVTPEGKDPYRLHLHLRNDGSGMLVINASTVLHLNPTAAEYAYHFVKGTPADQTAKEIAGRYRIRKATALEDFLNFAERIETLIDTPDLDPVTYLDFERVAPHSEALPAPLRLDCALTYQLPKDSQADYAPTKRVDRELNTDEWRRVLDIAWAAGIPHITLTGGEPTLREDLPQIIEKAEQNGQVCGLLTNGLKLADKKYLNNLLQTGLDHLLFLLQPEDRHSWKALESIMPEDIFVTVHWTVTPAHLKEANQTLEKLAGLGVTSLSLSISEESLKETLAMLADRAAELDLALTFDLPVPYSEDNPVSLEVKEEQAPRGAGKTWLYVEPDGDVLPAQGMAGSLLGNILKDPWEQIYKQ
ncbi:MAG: radical SAM protein [Anaerolineales bacterium]|nr:radical SAM protein [Anaerolineales bacterium]